MKLKAVSTSMLRRRTLTDLDLDGREVGMKFISEILNVFMRIDISRLYTDSVYNVYSFDSYRP